MDCVSRSIQLPDYSGEENQAMIFSQNVPSKIRKLEKQVADQQAELEAKDRIIQVQQAEIDSLASVVARDRARIEAECAAYGRTKAENESNGQPDASIQRFSA